MTMTRRPVDRSTRWSYTKPAIILHWLLALLLAVMVTLGWYMMSIEKQPGSAWYFNLHKSIGLVVLVVVLVRVVWRLRHKPQKLPTIVAPWQAMLAVGTQMLLYLCMVILPVTGMIGALSSKQGIVFFGIALPHLAPNHDRSEQLFSIHGMTVWFLVGLVALHVAGGLKHLLIDRDGVFQRMWPNSR